MAELGADLGSISPHAVLRYPDRLATVGEHIMDEDGVVQQHAHMQRVRRAEPLGGLGRRLGVALARSPHCAIPGCAAGQRCHVPRLHPGRQQQEQAKHGEQGEQGEQAGGGGRGAGLLQRPKQPGKPGADLDCQDSTTIEACS